MNKKRNFFLNSIAIILILMGIFRFFQVVVIANDFPRYFWFCNFSPLILGLAIYFRNSFVLIGQFSVLFLGQIFWTIDLIYFVFLKSFLFEDVARYILNEPLISQIATFSVHVFVLPLAIIAIFLIRKESKNAWMFSFILFALLLPIVFYYGAEYNLNLFYSHRIEYLPEFPLHSLTFPLAYIFVVVLPLSYLMNFLIRKFNKKK